MHSDPESNQRSRENTLAVSLVMITGGMVLFFLYIISLGIVGNVLAGGVIIAMFGALHYLVWGHAMSLDVAAEREAMLRQEAREQTPQARSASSAIQDIARSPAIETAPAAASQAIQDLSSGKAIKRPD